MILVLSGHGLRIPAETFALPDGITVKFLTREGIAVRDRVAGDVETDPDSLDDRLVVQRFSRRSLCPDYWLIDPSSPPLDIHNVPDAHRQFIPGRGEAYSLSYLLCEEPRIQDYRREELEVIWCACRSVVEQPEWKDSLRGKVA